MTATKAPAKAKATDQALEALRAEAEAAGIEVPEDATKAQVQRLIDAKASENQAGSPDGNDQVQPRAEPEAAPEPDLLPEPTPGERRPITRVTERGDWQDPFVDGDYLVIYSELISRATGAVRDDDEAVYPNAA